jgi:DNA mismatch repair ATPase MutS
MRRALLALVVLALATIVVAGAMNLVERQHTVREIRSLRDTLYASRVAADSCRWSLATQERRLQRYTALVDSLRGEVRDFEAMDARGVPEERYDEYIEHFEAYNDSVSSWEARAETLRVNEVGCRELVESHNALTDSLRRRIEAEGITEPEAR